MIVGGVIDLNAPKDVINSIDWEFQVTDTKWDTYPRTISSLINREYNRRKGANAEQCAPIFYQLNDGMQFKIDLSNFLQFNLQNNSVCMIRQQKDAETERLHYNKCPECLFKISPNDKVCSICNTQLPIQNNGNSESNNNKPEELQEEPPKQHPQPPVKEKQFTLCPSCNRKNKQDFNFCVGCGCSFNVRDNEPQNKENDRDANTDVQDNVNPGENKDSDVDVILEEQPGANVVLQSAMNENDVINASKEGDDSDIEIMDAPEGQVAENSNNDKDKSEPLLCID
eukprot:506049_1